MLWAMIRRDSAGDGAQQRHPSLPTRSPAVPGPAAIASIVAFDPDGDQEENDDLAQSALADGDSSTNWRTVCYAAALMSGKAGVGLVVDARRAGHGDAVVRGRQRPVPGRGVRRRRTPVPPGFADWGPPLDPEGGGRTRPTTVSVTARHRCVTC